MTRINTMIASLIAAVLAMISCVSAVAGTTDAVTSKTIALPAGNFSTVSLLATGVDGNQPNQKFVVSYTDGTATSFTQSLSDWHTPQNYAGESQASQMPYRLTATGATQSGPFYLYGYSFAINNAKTVKSLTLPQNRNVVVLSVDLGAKSGSRGASVNVKLSTAQNVAGIANYGKAVINGGLDERGFAYCANLIGSSVTWAGSTFTFGASGSSDAASRTTIALPSGYVSAVNLLATAVNGNQPDQTFVVTYSDGTTKSFTQSLSDWYTPQNFAGESKASDMAYRIAPSGVTDIGPFYLYGYSFAVSGAKTIKSITLPNNRNVVVLAVSTTAASAAPTSAANAAAVHVNLAAADNVVGVASNNSSVTNGGLDGEGYAYSATLLGGSVTWDGSTFSVGPSGATPPPPTSPTLAISGTPADTALIGKFYSFTPTVVASGGASLTYAVANRPSWAQFSAATGTLSGTPTGSAVTDANIVVSVSNGSQNAALPAFNIAVEAPVATPPASATLSWVKPSVNTNGSPLTNLAGYVIRYGSNAGSLTSQISVGSPNSTSAEIQNLTPGTWYFEIASINTASVESPFSSVASATIQ
ncbi:MAG: putative Ig domain-containing protein [Steroidobacteraceae bacterium]|jgi:hypothetical protein